MGEAATGSSAGIKGQPDGQQPAVTAGPAGASTGATEPPGTRTDNRTTTGTATEKTVVPALADGLEESPEERRKRQKREAWARAQERKKAIEEGREIPDWAKKQTPGTARSSAPAPARPKPKQKKQQAETFDAAAISRLLMTAFGLIATRPNMKHWALSKQEADQLAEPIADILADFAAASELLEKNSKYIALAMTAGAIFIPRVTMSITIHKMQEVVKHGVTAKPKTTTRTEPEPEHGPKAGTDSKINHSDDAGNSAEYGVGIYGLISPI